MTELTSGNIFALISNNYYKLTNSEKKAADYIFAHKSETQYMSISELAEECGVAEATISRFCKRLKLKGYNDFKLAIAKALVSGTEHEVTLSANAFSDAEITDRDNLTEMGEKLYRTHVAGLNQTLGLLNMEQVRKAVDVMNAAENVYCMGQGGSMLLAMEAEQMFSVISRNFRAISDSHRQVTYAALMTHRDVILYFSYSGSTKEIVELIHLAHEKGAKVILVTRFLKSPGAKQADVVLQCGSNEGPLQLGSIAAKMAQLFIIDVLYNEMIRRDVQSANRNQECIANALVVKHL